MQQILNGVKLNSSSSFDKKNTKSTPRLGLELEFDNKSIVCVTIEIYQDLHLKTVKAKSGCGVTPV